MVAFALLSRYCCFVRRTPIEMVPAWSGTFAGELLCFAGLRGPSPAALSLSQRPMLLDLKGLIELRNPCALEEDLGSWLSNTEAPSVFSDTQSSLKGESNPIDKLTVCVNTLWKAQDICPIGIICPSGMRLNMLEKEIAVVRNLLYIAEVNDKEMVIRNLPKGNLKQYVMYMIFIYQALKGCFFFFFATGYQ